MFGLFKKEKPLTRKERTEKILKKRGIKINFHLPNVEMEKDTHLRTPEEVAMRVTLLAVTNLVAFHQITGEEAIEFLQKYNLWAEATPKEKDFLSDPTEEKKNKESWKCEAIWTLLWALKGIDDLGFPDEMCDLNQIPSDRYPVSPEKDPKGFISRMKEMRSKTEILDQTDFYYRTNWACVDARINGLEMNAVNPGIVYERQYALNWLVHYMDQEWDDVTCDT
jgi:hypothetical protein